MHLHQAGDADAKFAKTKKIAILGFGNQGAAHALNLRDSGVKDIVIAGRPGASFERAKQAGFEVVSAPEAAAWADVLTMGAPDELQPDIYTSDLADHLKRGAALIFVHGFAIHFGLIEPRADLDVLMVAPAGPGSALRENFLNGDGYLGLFAVDRDVSGNARKIALSYGAGIGCGAGLIETSFREETETDLFGEQTVLCGGSAELARAGFETLVEAGYAPELAYLECLHQLKLLVDLIHTRGIAGMYAAISNTAEYGAYRTGPRVIGAETKAEMKRVLADIQSGQFARDWMAENKNGQPWFGATCKKTAAHPIEQVGAQLRAMMPWIGRDRRGGQGKD